jgi:hypothetical protein
MAHALQERSFGLKRSIRAVERTPWNESGKVQKQEGRGRGGGTLPSERA